MSLTSSFLRVGLALLPLFGMAVLEAKAAPSKRQIIDAVPCSQRFSLDSLRASALHSSPIVAEIDSTFAGELARAFDTEVLANPELAADHTWTSNTVQGAQDPQVQVVLLQPLRLSNFGARERVASLIRKTGDNQKGRQLLEFMQKLALQFYSLSVMQRTHQVLVKAEARAAEKVTLIREGVEKGLLSQGDEKLFEGERYRLQSQKLGVEVSMRVLQGELSRTAGLACYPTVQDQAKVAPLPAATILLEKARASQFNENTRADLLLSLAQEQTRLADLDAFPQFSPGIIYQHTNDGGDFLGAALTLQLPAWNRNQGGRGQSQGERVAALRKQEFLKNGGFETQIRILRAASATSLERAEIFSAKAVPAFEVALGSQEQLYAAGKGSVIQVWQTLRSYNDAQVEGLALWLEAMTNRIQLSLLIGEEV